MDKTLLLKKAKKITKRGKNQKVDANGLPEMQQDLALEAELELLTSYASDTVYRLKYDTMTYDYISPNISRLLGFSVEEIRTMQIRSLIIETRLITNGVKTVESFDELEDKRKKGDVNRWHADYLIRTKDGRKIWVMDVSYPWFDEDGNIIGSIGSLRDVTDRVMIENKMREELSAISNTDALTGLPNRPRFFADLDRELLRIRRTHGDVSMLLIHVDDFKNISDEHGTTISDAVIADISRIITSTVREVDDVARLGGEEFAVLLPETPAEGAYWLGERIRSAVLSHEFSVGTDKTPITCTVSVGIASASLADDITSSDMYKAADTRLYIAKHTGTNQVSADEMRQTH